MKVLVVILSLIIVLILFLSLMMFNNYEKDMLSMADQQLKSDIQHQENLNGSIEQYNELVTKYDKLNSSYIALGKEKGLSDNWREFLVTGYSAGDPEQGTTNLIKAGFNLDQDHVKKLPIIAVDENIIPLYSIVEIKDLGLFIALDTGSLIKGNHIDILFDSKEDAIKFGKKEYETRILNAN